MSSSSQNPSPAGPTEYAVLLPSGDIHWPTTVRSDAAVIASTYPDRTLVERTTPASEWTEASR